MMIREICNGWWWKRRLRPGRNRSFPTDASLRSSSEKERLVYGWWGVKGKDGSESCLIRLDHWFVIAEKSLAFVFEEFSFPVACHAICVLFSLVGGRVIRK
jgi:hypothetical protein